MTPGELLPRRDMWRQKVQARIASGQIPGSKAEGWRNNRARWNLNREVTRAISGGQFDLQIHCFEPNLDFIGKLLGKVARAKNADSFYGFAHSARQLREGDAHFTRDDVGVEPALTRLIFERAFQG